MSSLRKWIIVLLPLGLFVFYLLLHEVAVMYSSSVSESDSSVPSPPDTIVGEITPQKTPQRLRKYGRIYKVNSDDSSNASSIHVPVPSYRELPSPGSKIPEGASSDNDSSSTSSSSGQRERYSDIAQDPSCSGHSRNRSDSGNSQNSSDSGSNSPSGIDSDDSENGESATQKLYLGSKKSTDEAVVALMDLFVKKRWKIEILKDVHNYCKVFFPNNMPKTIYKLFQYVESYIPDYSEIHHFYCGDCLTRKEGRDNKCQECDSDSTGVFFEIPLSIQIKHFFEHRNLAALIESHKKGIPSDGSIADITSSEGFRELKTEVNGVYDVTLVFNTDGVSPVHSSKAHLYPILATICELPPKLRASFMLVCGIWYDLSFPPVMNDFLNPFVEALNRLYREGVLWIHPTSKEQHTTRVTAPVLSADALCRADVLVMQHHGGKHGCNNCEIKTKRFKPPGSTRKIRRYLFQERAAKLRDEVTMNRQGSKAEKKGLPVKGIVGHAVVSKIPHFNRGASAPPPEYMHCVLLGVVKQFLRLWFETPGDWNIKKKLAEIDLFIKNSVKVTDQYGRIPKKIKDVKLWKASDLRVWLLFISLPALVGHLKEQYFKHWMLFVSAIYALLKDKITERDIVMAETKLRVFVRDVSKLYRLQEYTYNLHNLLHLGEHVRRWGPLWATSAFCFEDFNHVLGELAHGPKHKGQQIVKKIRLAHGLEVLRNKVFQSGLPQASEITVLGKPIVIDLNLTAFDLPNDTNGYLRANVNREIFTTQLYDQTMVRTNSCVSFRTDNNSIGYGEVLYFYVRNEDICCLINKFKVEQQKIFIHNDAKFSCLHLIPVSETGNVISISAASLLSKHAKIKNFLCIRPNVVESKNL